MSSTGSLPHVGPRLELEVGSEIIEVCIDSDGIHFRHPDGNAAQGHLPWEVAIAMCMLPVELKRSAA